MTTYRTTQRAIVREQPSAFARELRRLPKDDVFRGWPYRDPAWVMRVLGGFVARDRVVEVSG